jgi:hypothetical protein
MYMNRASDSLQVSADVAARSREADKRSRFERALQRATSVVEEGCTQENFVPFVFYKRVCPPLSGFSQRCQPRCFTEQAAIICARDLGRAILQSRGIVEVRGSRRSK